MSLGLVRTILYLIFALLIVGCASSAPGSMRPTVAVSTSVWADVVANVACADELQIITLIPLGVDPHAFEPSLSDRATLADVDLIVASGNGLEEGLVRTLQSAQADGIALVWLAERIGADDPHAFLDPIQVVAALPVLADALVAEVGLAGEEVSRCAADYQDELEAIDAEITEIVESIPRSQRRLVTGHDALGPFADRYGFEVLGTVIPSSSSLASSSPAQLEALALAIERADVPAIFVEAGFRNDDVDALVARVGDIDVIELRIEGSAGTYGELLLDIAIAMADALS